MLSGACKPWSVYLSGGGLKGAYQYGFFRRVYAKRPQFQIDRVYCMSVGSLNALPIFTRRIEFLDAFWNTSANPFDKILIPWKPGQFDEILKHRTLYAGIDLNCIDQFWNSCDLNTQSRLKNITIISYDTLNCKPVFQACSSVQVTRSAIETSCCFPGLYPNNPQHPNIIDGCLMKDDISLSLPKTSQWLCLDMGRGPTKNFTGAHVYGSHALSNLACVDWRHETRQKLIAIGEQDADDFLVTLQ